MTADWVERDDIARLLCVHRLGSGSAPIKGGYGLDYELTDAIISKLRAALNAAAPREPVETLGGQPRADYMAEANRVLDAPKPAPDTFNRERLGKLVRHTWIVWAKDQPNPKPSWLVPYDDLSEPDKEADRRIGENIAQDIYGRLLVAGFAPEGAKRAHGESRMSCSLRANFQGRPPCEQGWAGDWAARPKWGPDNCCLADTKSAWRGAWDDFGRRYATPDAQTLNPSEYYFKAGYLAALESKSGGGSTPQTLSPAPRGEEGWVLVPREPTEEMVEAGTKALRAHIKTFKNYDPALGTRRFKVPAKTKAVVRYKAMLAAAPKTPGKEET